MHSFARFLPLHHGSHPGPPSWGRTTPEGETTCEHHAACSEPPPHCCLDHGIVRKRLERIDRHSTPQPETARRPADTEAPAETEARPTPKHRRTPTHPPRQKNHRTPSRPSPPARGDADLVIWADDTRARSCADRRGVLGRRRRRRRGARGALRPDPRQPVRPGPRRRRPRHHRRRPRLARRTRLQRRRAPIDLGPDADLYSDVASAPSPTTASLRPAVRDREHRADPQHRPRPRGTGDVRRARRDRTRLQADGTVEVPLAVQQDPADPYHNYPLFSGSGGYVFGVNEDGSYIPDDVGIDSDGGLAAAELRGLERVGPDQQRRQLRRHDRLVLDRRCAVRHHRPVGRRRLRGRQLRRRADPAGRRRHPERVRRVSRAS